MATTAELNGPSTIARVRAGALRFVQRGEKRILQQQWETVLHHGGVFSSRGFEWRDVPLVDETVAVSPETAITQDVE